MSRMIVTLLLCLVSAGAGAQGKWQLKKEEDGIKVFTTNIDNSCFKSVMVECIVNATPSQLVAYLLDVDKQPEWVYNTTSTTLVKKIKENELIFYSQVDVPWPVANRDYIAHIVINQVSPELISIDSHAEPDLLPVKKGFVRVPSSVTHWDITPYSPGQLKIVYTVRFDPGGAVPAWLNNLFVAKGPYNTFQKLRAGASKQAYHNAHFDFIK